MSDTIMTDGYWGRDVQSPEDVYEACMEKYGIERQSGEDGYPLDDIVDEILGGDEARTIDVASQSGPEVAFAGLWGSKSRPDGTYTGFNRRHLYEGVLAEQDEPIIKQESSIYLPWVDTEEPGVL